MNLKNESWEAIVKALEAEIMDLQGRNVAFWEMVQSERDEIVELRGEIARINKVRDSEIKV